MNKKIILKILNLIMICGVIIIIILLFTLIKNKENVRTSEEDVQDDIINNYDEINIAYSIMYIYTTYLYNGDYSSIINLYANPKNITEERFNSIKENIVEDYNFDILIDSQRKVDKNTYKIEYSSQNFGNGSMTYTINKNEYSFYIKEDSKFGVEINE